MLRWISTYIDRHQESWEKGEREMERRNRVRDWEKLKRFEKISAIREREKEKETPKDRETQESNGWRWDRWRKEERKKDESKLNESENDDDEELVKILVELEWEAKLVETAPAVKGELVCSASTKMGEVVCSAPVRGEVVCLAPMGGELVYSASTKRGRWYVRLH